MIDNRFSWKSEWHVFSSLFITCALMFIVINSSTGTPQVIGASFSPVVGGVFLVSENWKNMPTIVHKWVVAISVLAVFSFIIWKRPGK